MSVGDRICLGILVGMITGASVASALQLRQIAQDVREINETCGALVPHPRPSLLLAPSPATP